MNAPSKAAASSPDIDIVELTIADVQKGFLAGRFTSESLTRLHLERIEAYEPFYNAFTFMNPNAIAEARAIDERRKAGETLGPLAGVPVVVKEAMDFAGLPSTAGWARLSSRAGGVDLIPERDAPVVARLRSAGAVILGKTNIPAFSHDGARANSSWDGPTFNAVDRAIAPGASSSGTATAVSGSFAVVGLAEETGGSIQNPASAQSLIGLKPTFALVPNSGVAPLAGSTRDVVGPHARTVIDAALLLDVLAGYSPEDPKTVAAIDKIPEGGYSSKLSKDALKGARLGLYGPGWRSNNPLSDECGALYARAVDELKSLGAVVVEDPFAGQGLRRSPIRTSSSTTAASNPLPTTWSSSSAGSARPRPPTRSRRSRPSFPRIRSRRKTSSAFTSRPCRGSGRLLRIQLCLLTSPTLSGCVLNTCGFSNR
jgi:Asp-tRNA(Asn)/Glu-tRNA(Gln) amidotransferase A subunit family amidase